MIQFKAIVLDLDGPLLDVMQRHYRCYADILTANGMTPISLPQYWELKRKPVGHRSLLALSHAEEVESAFRAAWAQKIESVEYLALDRLQDGVPDILGQWRESGIRCWLATMRNHPGNLKWQLEELGIAPLLDKVVAVGSSSNGAAKAEGVKPILNLVQPDEVVWVGDTEVDIQAARRLGVRVCALSCGLRDEAFLAGLGPDMLEMDLQAFAGRNGET